MSNGYWLVSVLRLVQTRPFERKRLRVLIRHAPNPYHLRELGPSGIQKLLRSHSVPCGVKTATLVHDVACLCLLPPEWLACSLAKQLQDQFAIYRLLEKQLKEQEEKALDLLVGTPGHLLVTYPGASDLLVARYLACVQDWTRFPSAKHILHLGTIKRLKTYMKNSINNLYKSTSIDDTK